jgi:hypothetical protein
VIIFKSNNNMLRNYYYMDRNTEKKLLEKSHFKNPERQICKNSLLLKPEQTDWAR